MTNLEKQLLQKGYRATCVPGILALWVAEEDYGLRANVRSHTRTLSKP